MTKDDILDISNDPEKIITVVVTLKGQTEEIRDLNIVVMDYTKEVYNVVRLSEFQLNELYKAIKSFKEKEHLTDTETTDKWGVEKA